MYCSNCGSRFNQNDLFCSECGQKSDCSKVQKKKFINKSIFKFSKSEKKVIVVILLFIVLTLIYICINKTFFSEDQIIRQYVKAYSNNDYETIINLSDIEKNEFMSSEVIEKKYGRKNFDIVKVDILSENNNKGEHTRTVQYYKDGNEKNIINLNVKKQGKSFFLFDNYIITSNNLTAENIRVIVPKGIKLRIDDVEMGNEYKDTQTNGQITYKVSQVLSKNVLLELELKNNLVITSTRNFFDNESITVESMYNNKLDDKSSDKIQSRIKKIVESVVISAINGEDISKLSTKGMYTSGLLKSNLFSINYNNLIEKYSAVQVKDFSVTSIEINNIYLDSSDIDSMEFNSKVSYTYRDQSNKKQSSSKNIKIVLNNGDELKVEEFYLNNLYSLFR